MRLIQADGGGAKNFWFRRSRDWEAGQRSPCFETVQVRMYEILVLNPSRLIPTETNKPMALPMLLRSAISCLSTYCIVLYLLVLRPPLQYCKSR